MIGSVNISEFKGPGRGKGGAAMGGQKIPKDKVTADIDKFIRMEARGCSREEKLREIFGIDQSTATYREINNADAKMCRWRKHPLFDQIWKDELSRQDYSDIIESMSVLRKGMRQDKDGWLAMNSAVNAINNAGKRLFHDEDSVVSVKIEGMPDIGTPEEDE